MWGSGDGAGTHRNTCKLTPPKCLCFYRRIYNRESSWWMKVISGQMDVNLGIIITNQSWEEDQDFRLDAQVFIGGIICLVWNLSVAPDTWPRVPWTLSAHSLMVKSHLLFPQKTTSCLYLMSFFKIKKGHIWRRRL